MHKLTKYIPSKVKVIEAEDLVKDWNYYNFKYLDKKLDEKYGGRHCYICEKRFGPDEKLSLIYCKIENVKEHRTLCNDCATELEKGDE